MTAGLDLGDNYSYLCLIDTQSGEVVEEGRLRSTPEALRRRFVSEPSLRIAMETGTHSPWVRAGSWRSAATRCWWPMLARQG
jgi:transposase